MALELQSSTDNPRDLLSRWLPLCLAVSLLSAAACSGDEKDPTDSDSTDESANSSEDSDDSSDDGEDEAADSERDSGRAGGGIMRADAGLDASMGRDSSDGGKLDAGATGDASTTPSEPAGACTRESLKAAVDQYFEALATHDPSTLPTAPDVKFTENGEELELGAGLWENAGAVKFKHSAADTETCTTVTEAVVPDGSTDIPFALRLKLVDQKITEVETIAVRRGDYFTPSSTAAIIASGEDDWEAVVPPEQRATREELKSIIDTYFGRFPNGACNFADDCDERLENGFSPGACGLGLMCSMSGSGGGRSAMTPRLHVIDVEAGIVAGFVMFAGAYTDVHLFKVYGGEVHGLHAILASAESPGWP